MALAMSWFCALSAQTVLLQENFDGGALPDGWTQQTLATDGGWLGGACPQALLCTVHGNGHSWPGIWGNQDIHTSREVNPGPGVLLLFQYSDGTVEKRKAGE